MRPVVNFILILAFLGIARANDVCFSPFSSFLKCMADDADKKLERYLDELSPGVKQQVQQCFTKFNCQAPDFSKATVDNFLSPPWNDRAKVILSLMENMDPKVKDCMINYFKGMIKDKIEDCVHKNGPDELKNFEMPPLPDIHNTDITKFKEVVLNRMLVRTYVTKCGTDHGGASANKTVDCIADARNQHDKTLCTTREQCRESKLTDSKCRDRFDKVHAAACKCVQDHKANFNASRLILGGQLETQFKKCHRDNGVPYPQDKVDKAKEVITQIAAELLASHKLPDEVKKTINVARAALKDIEQQWKGAFCAKCSKDGDQSSVVSDQEITDLRKSIGAGDSKEN
jgi:hypothetical protein